MNGPSLSDDAYVAALEKQCADWEAMYADLKAENLNLKAENEQLKSQLNIAVNGASAMVEKSNLRHV